MLLVTFRCEGEPDIYVSTEKNENLLKAARRAGVVIDAPCSGNGSCGKCLVRIVSGKLDSPKTFYINDVEYEEGWRLACTSRICGDVEVLVG